MRPHHLTLLLLALILLAACSAPAAPTQPPMPPVSTVGPLAATPTVMSPITLPDVVPGRGLVYLDLPARDAPDADPTFTYIGFIVDRDTGAPVTAAAYLFADQVRREPQPADLVVADATDSFVVKLPADFNGRLIVRAEGYREWEMQLEHSVKTSRTMKGPVQLVPQTTQGL